MGRTFFFQNLLKNNHSIFIPDNKLKNSIVFAIKEEIAARMVYITNAISAILAQKSVRQNPNVERSTLLGTGIDLKSSTNVRILLVLSGKNTKNFKTSFSFCSGNFNFFLLQIPWMGGVRTCLHSESY